MQLLTNKDLGHNVLYEIAKRKNKTVGFISFIKYERCLRHIDFILWHSIYMYHSENMFCKRIYLN